MEQVNLLEQNFGNEHKLESERKDRLAMELGLDPRQVAVWFQNRRARWKNKKLEEEYSNLKKSHEANLLEKCRLESEVHLFLIYLIYYNYNLLIPLLNYVYCLFFIEIKMINYLKARDSIQLTSESHFIGPY